MFEAAFEALSSIRPQLQHTQVFQERCRLLLQRRDTLLVP